MIFVDPKYKLLFVGDALATMKGVWMQASHSLPLSQYAVHLQKLLVYFEENGIDDTWEMWSGHEKSGGHILPHKTNISYIQQSIELCHLLLDGKITGTPSDEPTFDGTQA